MSEKFKPVPNQNKGRKFFDHKLHFMKNKKKVIAPFSVSCHLAGGTCTNIACKQTCQKRNNLKAKTESLKKPCSGTCGKSYLPSQLQYGKCWDCRPSNNPILDYDYWKKNPRRD